MTVVLPAVHELPPARSFVVVKLSLRGETYRIPFTHDELTWRALETKVDECYDDIHRPAVWTLVYRDDEGDLVTVSNEREFREASFVFSELVEQPNEEEHALHMHFYVVAKLSLKEQLAPVMQTVTEISEKMARIAVETRDSLRKSSYVERGRESLHQSAVHTRQALSSARRGLSQRMRRASADISDIPRRLRTRSRVSSGDVRDDTASPQTLMATNVEHDDGDEVHAERHVAELLERSRVESTDTEDNTVDEQPNESARANTPTQSVVPVLNAVADDDVEDIGHASDAETASTASEGTHDEWDVVQSSSPERPPSPFFEVEVDDEMEASFTRWESELATIRDIMPQIDLDLCVDLLTKHNGKLEATLVELTEL